MATDIKSFRAVIELWDTREDLADEFDDLGASTVSKWWQRDNIPCEYWSTILSTETAIEAELTAGRLAVLASRERSMPVSMDEEARA